MGKYRYFCGSNKSKCMFASPEDFLLKPEYFNHPSDLHGFKHTYRVMCHVLIIGNEMQLEREKRLAFCAAFVHDMARNHDGFSLRHGPRAAKEKVPLFVDMFCRNGVAEEDIDAIKLAVANHSQYSEIDKKNPDYNVVALLKDADALDRIRLGNGNLNEKYLRFEVSKKLIVFAEKLFRVSDKMKDLTFMEMKKVGEKILGKGILGL